MADLEVRIDGAEVAPLEGWSIRWLDAGRGIAAATDGRRRVTVLVEGSGSERVVTLDGRRILVSVRTARERMLAEVDAVGSARRGSGAISASLPGLVVAVAVTAGMAVTEGEPLVTIEAMKMQNVIRAPRSGIVTSVEVTAGQRVMAGDPILRIE